jgi:hypothetical protein
MLSVGSGRSRALDQPCRIPRGNVTISSPVDKVTDEGSSKAHSRRDAQPICACAIDQIITNNSTSLLPSRPWLARSTTPETGGEQRAGFAELATDLSSSVRVVGVGSWDGLRFAATHHNEVVQQWLALSAPEGFSTCGLGLMHMRSLGYPWALFCMMIGVPGLRLECHYSWMRKGLQTFRHEHGGRRGARIAVCGR